MSIIHRQKDKHGNSNYDIGTNSIEGTSARTRAFSFEQVMSRRRNKKLDEDAKEKTIPSKLIPERGDTENAPPHTGPASGNNLRKDSKDITRSLKTKEESVPTRKTSPRKHKDKIHQDLEANEKAKSSHEKSSRDKEFKKEKQSHHRSRTDDRLKVDFERGSSRKHSKDAQIKDKHNGEYGKSMREKKRKNLNGIDEKSRRDMDGFTPKKHDSGKRQDLEPFKRRRIQTYEEPRSERRGSRSQEYDRGRDRGSVSVSPRVHKRSFHGRDYGESSSRSLKDRPGMQYSDADKYRTSGNGGYEGGRYQRRGRGLGGYSPRKRRPDAVAIKIPSPTARLPERKGATWDLPPSEVNNTISVPIPGNLQLSTQNVHEQPPSIPESPVKVNSQQTPSTSALAISLASIDSVHLTQATRPMRRLYIENLPASATDKSITRCLNDFLLSTGANHIPGTQPCISCIIDKEKCQAIVEFLTPEDATAALFFDGKSFSGSILKLRRPKDFIDATPTTGTSEKPAAVVNTIADVVKDSPYKIFIGGISEFLSSDMLLEIVSVFGPVKAFRFEFNSELNQPCAFLEYVDQSITQKACAGLNGMKLGGSVLTVVIALQDNTHLGEEDDEKPPFYGIPEHARPLLEDPTQVLKLKNVFDQDNFLQLSESELEEIVEDIHLECARFGSVKSVNAVRYENRDNTTTKAGQDLMDESGKIKSREDICGGDANQIAEQVPFDDIKKTLDTRDILRNMEANVDNIDTDLEKRDYHCSSQVAADAIQEEPPGPEVAGGEPGSRNEVDEVDKPEGGHGIDNGLVRDEPKQVDVSTELGKSLPELDSTVPEESGANAEDGNHWSADDMLEPGCVLVEFLRKEVTCMAAHSLNGRIYDGRMVAASYVAHDVYVSHFPR